MPGVRTRIELCGELLAEVAGRRVEDSLPGRRGRLLFAYLVTNRDRPVTRDELIELLWPQDRPRSPEAALSTLLTRLRHAVGEGVIRGRSQLTLVLSDDAAVDLEEARRLAAQSDRDLPADPRQAVEAARSALAIVGRPFLPGIEANWAEEVRRDLEALRLSLLELAAKAGLALGDAELPTAERDARQVVSSDPFRESAYGLLMRAAAARGNVAAALLAYDELRVTLREELGTAPSRALTELHGQLLRGEADATAEASFAPELTLGSAAFVGRLEELESLRRAWAAAVRGSRRFIVLEGEAGIGKTALAAAFGREVHAAGAHAVFGRADEQTVVPYQPFVEALRLLLAGMPDEPDDPLAPALSRLLPELGPADEFAVDPETNRYRLFEAVAQVFRRAAERRPIVFVVDDLHWADADTLLLLRHVLRSTSSSRLLVIGTFRRGEPLPALLADSAAELRRTDGYERISLAGLDKAEVSQLLVSRVDADAADRLALVLHRRTAGNPLYLVESLRDVNEADRPGFQRDLDPDRLSEGVKEAIARRVERLGPAAGRILELAAVAGPEFEVGVLEEVEPPRSARAARAVDAAVASGLLVEVPETDRLAFSHAVVRETLYVRLSAVRRRRLHALLGKALETRRLAFPVEASELALHYFDARGVVRDEDVTRYSVEAAEEAAKRLAYQESAAHYERALVAAEDVEGAARCDLLLALGDALERSGDITGARERFREAADLARGSGESQRLARATLGFAAWQQFGAIDQEAVALLNEALTAVSHEDVGTRARLLGLLAVRLDPATEQARREALVAEALAAGRSAADADTLATVLAHVPYVLSQMDHAVERIEAASESIALAEQSGRPEWALRGRMSRFGDVLSLGDVEAADRDLEEYVALAERLRDPWSSWYSRMLLATRAIFGGEIDAGRELADEALRLRLEQDPDADEIHVVQEVMALRAQDPGDVDLDRVRDLADRFPSRPGCRALYAACAAELGDLDAAHEAVDLHSDDGFATARRSPDSLNALALFAEAAACVDHAAAATALYATLAPFADRNVVMSGGWACWGSLSYQLGLLARTLGDEGGAHRHLEAALAANERMAALPWAERTRRAAATAPRL